MMFAKIAAGLAVGFGLQQIFDYFTKEAYKVGFADGEEKGHEAGHLCGLEAIAQAAGQAFTKGRQIGRAEAEGGVTGHVGPMHTEN